jgi:hypothetical protein
MRTQDPLADSVLACKHLLGRYLAGFGDQNHTRQAPTLPNHVAWTLGHLAMTMHRVAEKLDGRPMPTEDLAPGGAAPSDPATRFPPRFGAEQVAFGSRPVDAPEYPSFGRCVQIYESACERLAGAVREASDRQLAAAVQWGAGESALLLLVARMIFHNGMHTGQIADLRRALGMGTIL